MHSIRIIVYFLPVHLAFINLSDPLLYILNHFLPLLRNLIRLDVPPPWKQTALLMKYKRLIVVLALIVPLVPLLAHEHPVDTDLIPLRESLHVLLVLTHDYLVAAHVLLVSLQVLNDFIDYPLVLGVQGLHEFFSLFLAFNKTLGLVEQVNVHNVEVIKVVQVIIEDDMQVLLYLFF